MGKPKKRKGVAGKKGGEDGKPITAEGREIPTIGQYIVDGVVSTVFTVIPPGISIFIRWLVSKEEREPLSIAALVMPELFLAVFTFSCNTIHSIESDHIISEIKKRTLLNLSRIIALFSFAFYIVESAFLHFTGDMLYWVMILAGTLIVGNAIISTMSTIRKARAEIALINEAAKAVSGCQDADEAENRVAQSPPQPKSPETGGPPKGSGPGGTGICGKNSRKGGKKN